MKTVKQGVYAFLNRLNGKVYVGSSENMPARRARHLRELRSGRHRNTHFQSSFDFHGEPAFEFVVIETVEDVLWLRAREQAWIKTLQAIDREFGYNITGDAWSPLSNMYRSEERKARFLAAQQNPKTRKRHSEAAIKWRRERPPVRHSRKWKQAQSQRSKKFWGNPQHKENLSRLSKEWHADPENKKLHSDAQKRLYKDPLERIKQSQSQKRRYKDPEARRVTAKATKAGIASKRAAGANS